MCVVASSNQGPLTVTFKQYDWNPLRHFISLAGRGADAAQAPGVGLRAHPRGVRHIYVINCEL